MKTYREKLRHPKWQEKRLRIMERDGFACTICGDNESCLNVHHDRYARSGDPWDVPNENLRTLCEKCHADQPSSKRAISKTVKNLRAIASFAKKMEPVAVAVHKVAEAGRAAYFRFSSEAWSVDQVARCSQDAERLWFRILMVMHECEPSGTLTLAGRPMSHEEAARRCGIGDTLEYRRLLGELLRRGVAKRDGNGAICSPRMMKDAAELTSAVHHRRLARR